MLGFILTIIFILVSFISGFIVCWIFKDKIKSKLGLK